MQDMTDRSRARAQDGRARAVLLALTTVGAVLFTLVLLTQAEAVDGPPASPASQQVDETAEPPPSRASEPSEPSAAGRTQDQEATTPDQLAASDDRAGSEAGAEREHDAAALVGPWSTQGRRIVDGDGSRVDVRAVTWFGFDTAFGAPHGLWARPIDKLLDAAADAGFNTLRLPVSSAMLDGTVRPDEGAFANEPDLAGSTSLELLDEVVARADARGLAVVLVRRSLAPDQSPELWYDDAHPRDRFEADLRQLAKRYVEAPNVMGIALADDLHGAACWGCADAARDWRAAAKEGGDAVHEVAPDWLILVPGVERPDGRTCEQAFTGGCSWHGSQLGTVNEMPVELAQPDRIVYTPYDHGPSVFRQPWLQGPGFPDDLPSVWSSYWGRIAEQDVAPVMVNMGTTLERDDDRTWARSLLRYLDEHEIGFSWFALNANVETSSGVLEEDWATPDDVVVELLQPYLTGPFG